MKSQYFYEPEIKKTKMMEEAFLKIAREKNWDLAFRFKFSGTHYQNAGIDAKTAEKLQMQAAEAAIMATTSESVCLSCAKTVQTT